MSAQHSRLRELLRVLPVLLAVAVMWLLEASKLEEPQPVRELQPAPPETRLVVFWIDSLAWRDVENRGLLPRITERAEAAGLRGPVRSCADAVSVACFTAMTTGVDRFSIFSLGNNFGGMEGAIEGSLVQQLQARGKRIGYLGDPIFERAVAGFDWAVIQHEIDDLADIERGLEELDAQQLDLLVIHLRETDAISHRQGPEHEVYASKMRRLDQAIDNAIDRLKRSDTVVILGDHGHTEDGRHFAGLDVPTYALFLGSAFERRLRRPMAMTDHAAIWGRVLGLRFGSASWVDDYFDDRPLSTPEELPQLPGTPPTPWWALLVSLLGALGIVLTRRVLSPWESRARRRADQWRGLALTFTFAICAGAFWTTARPLISDWPMIAHAVLALAIGSLGALATRGLAGTRWRMTLLLGSVLFALPTIYTYGSVAAATRMLMLLLGAEVISASLKAEYRRAVWSLGSLTLSASVFNPSIENFSVGSFGVYAETLRPAALPLCIALLMFTLWLARGRDAQRWLGAATVGLVLAPLPDLFHVRLALVPAVFAMPLCMAALHNARWAGPALALAIPALWFTFSRDPVALGPVMAVLAMWTVVPRALPLTDPRERAVVVLVLLWLSLWTGFGCRLSGVQFQYFFEWLPEGADIKDTWAANAVITVFKYMLPGGLGLVLASRVWKEPLAPALWDAWGFANLKLGAVIAFLAAFAFASSNAGPFIISDVTQEAAVWVLVLMTLMAAPWSLSPRRSHDSHASAERKPPFGIQRSPNEAARTRTTPPQRLGIARDLFFGEPCARDAQRLGADVTTGKVSAVT